MTKIYVDDEVAIKIVVKNLKWDYKNAYDDTILRSAIEVLLNYYMPYPEAAQWLDKQKRKEK